MKNGIGKLTRNGIPQISLSVRIQHFAVVFRHNYDPTCQLRYPSILYFSNLQPSSRLQFQLILFRRASRRRATLSMKPTEISTRKIHAHVSANNYTTRINCIRYTNTLRV